MENVFTCQPFINYKAVTYINWTTLLGRCLYYGMPKTLTVLFGIENYSQEMMRKLFPAWTKESLKSSDKKGHP